MTTIATVAAVNAALKRAGAAERLVRGKGYYYFAGGDAARWYSASVFVNRVSALSVDEWLREWSEKRAAALPAVEDDEPAGLPDAPDFVRHGFRIRSGS